MRSARAPQAPLCHRHATPVSATTPEWRVFGIALGDDGRMLYVAQTRAERAEAQFEVAHRARCWRRWRSACSAYFWLRRAGAPRAARRCSACRERLAAARAAGRGATLGPAERAELRAGARSDRPARPAPGAAPGARARLHRPCRACAAHAAGRHRRAARGGLRESPAALQPRLQRAREAAGRLQRVVAALLTLFRSDGEPVREAVDLAALLRQFPLERCAGRPCRRRSRCTPIPTCWPPRWPTCSTTRSATARATCDVSTPCAAHACAWTTTARA